MASRAWSPIIRIWLVALIVMTAVSWNTTSVKADSGGTCQIAYGLIPTSILDWLMPVNRTTNLATTNRNDVLAAELLSSGLVDGATCPALGLNPDGSANGCGIEHTHNQVLTWQNQFDSVILSSSQAAELPPKVVKAVIAVESQFWPAANWTLGENGLGQMTTYGADLVLMWRPAYFQSICRQTYGEKGCATQYQFLDSSTQFLLRGMVLRDIEATCPNCPGGVDFEKGNQAIRVLIETLNASCMQPARIFNLVTGKQPAAFLSYDD